MLSKCLQNSVRQTIHFKLSPAAVRKTTTTRTTKTSTGCSLIRGFHPEVGCRFYSSNPPKSRPQSKAEEMFAISKRSAAYYSTAAVVLCVGLTYAAVPLYRLFCQSTGYGGTINENHDASRVEHMKKVKDRVIKINFNADIGASMRWNFKPQQLEIRVVPGETALAFYTARNPTDVPVIGVSTYNVIPFEAGQYFNKIQCFCFEAQQLNPHEEVDMPVFFYIDPEFADDPKMEFVDTITLSYTFFESKDGLNIPVPNYARAH